MTRLLVLVGAGLLLAGLVVGFAVPVDSGEFDCGSAFVENGDLQVDEYTDAFTGGDGVSGCDEERSSAKTLPIVLLILGLVALVGSPFVERRSQPPST